MNVYEKFPEIFKNPRIAKRLQALELTEEQIMEALPILLDMASEKVDANTLWLTSFKVNSAGAVVRTQEASALGRRKAYIQNIVTRHLEDFFLNDEDKLFQEPGRANFMLALKKLLSSPGTSKKGLYLHGSYGVGKTFLMKRLARRLAQEGAKVAFISAPTLAQELKKALSSSQTNTYSLHSITDLLKTADYLFLDDLGAESISAWFRDECLFPILNYRMQRERPTFFTSNFSLAKLELKESTTTNNRFREIDKAKRLVSRVKSLAIPVEITGTNKRY